MISLMMLMFYQTWKCLHRVKLMQKTEDEMHRLVPVPTLFRNALIIPLISR